MLAASALHRELVKYIAFPPHTSLRPPIPSNIFFQLGFDDFTDEIDKSAQDILQGSRPARGNVLIQTAAAEAAGTLRAIMATQLLSI